MRVETVFEDQRSGDRLVASYDEEWVSFRLVGGRGYSCDAGAYQWVTLAEVFVDGVSDGPYVQLVVVERAGEWVRNRLADFALAGC